MSQAKRSQNEFELQDLEVGGQEGSRQKVIPQKLKELHDDKKVATDSWWFALKLSLSNLNIMVHNQSKRDIQAAIQMTASFVFAALIGFKSDIKNQLSIGWILTVLAPLLIGDTLGTTILACRSAIVNFIPAAILIYVLQVLGMGYHTYTSSCIIFFIVCFWMGYINPSMAARKIALLLPVIMITIIVTTPNAYLASDFIWQFVAECFIGLAVDLAISLFLLPTYATFEVSERFNYTLQRNAEVLELLVSAMLAEHKAESEIYLCEADELIRCMQENQDAIGMRAFVATYEPMSLLRVVFRSKQVVFNRYGVMELAALNSTIFWHVSCIAQSVRHISFNEYHSHTWGHARLSFQDIVAKYHVVVCLLGNERNGHAQDVTAIDAAIIELKAACDHMYSALSQGLKSADRIEGEEAQAAGNTVKGTISWK